MLKANKVTSQGYLQSKDINRILIVISFQDLLAGAKFETIQIFHVGQQRKGRKTMKFTHLFEKKGTKFARIHQNPTKHWPTATKQSYPSKFRTFRLKCKYSEKSRLSSLLHYFYCFNILVPRIKSLK